ncbi:MAG TPA: cupredoxin domain-containing protein [Candidatus Limnocylindria bacterium]|nr:cupredoxin domain-containing protein [Candidatus Limnocylindria bacterium]
MFLVAATLLVAACSSGGGATTGPAAPGSSAPAASASVTRTEVNLTDGLRIEPRAMTVPAGVPVTFMITNRGATDHEFYLGDEEAQGAHEKEMVEMGGMGHDEPQGIPVKPGQTRELTYTFSEPGETLAGCHVAGHYGGGMRATIVVSG